MFRTRVWLLLAVSSTAQALAAAISADTISLGAKVEAQASPFYELNSPDDQSSLHLAATAICEIGQAETRAECDVSVKNRIESSRFAYCVFQFRTWQQCEEQSDLIDTQCDKFRHQYDTCSSFIYNLYHSCLNQEASTPDNVLNCVNINLEQQMGIEGPDDHLNLARHVSPVTLVSILPPLTTTLQRVISTTSTLTSLPSLSNTGFITTKVTASLTLNVSSFPSFTISPLNRTINSSTGLITTFPSITNSPVISATVSPLNRTINSATGLSSSSTKLTNSPIISATFTSPFRNQSTSSVKLSATYTLSPLPTLQSRSHSIRFANTTTSSSTTANATVTSRTLSPLPTLTPGGGQRSRKTPSSSGPATQTGLRTADTSLSNQPTFTGPIPTGPGPVSIPPTQTAARSGPSISSSSTSHPPHYTTSTTTSDKVKPSTSSGRSTNYPSGRSAVSSLQSESVPSNGPGGKSHSVNTSSAARSLPSSESTTTTTTLVKTTKSNSASGSVTVGPIFTSKGKVCSVITSVVTLR